MAFFVLGFIFLLVSQVSTIIDSVDRNLKGTVAFATVGRAHYAFDIFLLDSPLQLALEAGVEPSFESRITDGSSVNYNGFLVDFPEHQTLLTSFDKEDLLEKLSKSGHGMLAYVSERDGTAQIHFSVFIEQQGKSLEQKTSIENNNKRREASETHSDDGTKIINLGTLPSSTQELNGKGARFERIALHDKPSIANGKMIFVSTREPLHQPRQSWTAVYSTDIRTKKTIRLTPEEVSDYSPAVSPSGHLVMVASLQEKGWGGEVDELNTDLYVFNAEDGSERRLVARHGGWPSWADDSTVFFHRRAPDGWWSVYRVSLSSSGEPERITPPGVHAFTPAASRSGEFVAVVTRRPGSAYRHVELFDLAKKTFHGVTERFSPDSHHLNPFFSPDSGKLGYHRCRGKSRAFTPRLELIRSPVEEISLVRVDGDFPVFSPDGQHIAFIPDLDVGGIYITSLNGSGMVRVFDEPAFGLSWDKQRSGVLYTSFGQGFKPEGTAVHIISILNADKLVSGEAGVVEWKLLTKEGTSNNAFPSASPDGKFVVFRSGRSGHKNLYIMDAFDGEVAGLRRLTDGAWTDTMPNWSPDGEWIAFSSDRHSPGGGSFQLYFVHPDGTGLHRVLNSSTGGRVNHPFFSPDSRSLVFTSDYAGISAEPVSLPNQFQPYGEIFMARIDGSELTRLTHNMYEDGTPSWGPKRSSPLVSSGGKSECKFDDSRWLKPPKLGVDSVPGVEAGRC